MSIKPEFLQPSPQPRASPMLRNIWIPTQVPARAFSSTEGEQYYRARSARERQPSPIAESEDNDGTGITGVTLSSLENLS